MKIHLKELATPVATTLVSLLPSVIRAQNSPLPIPGTGIGSVGDIIGTTQNSLLCKVFGWLFWLLIILAVVFVIFAAFRYLTAGGEPEKIKKANYSLIYAVVAIVVALLARALPNIIFGFVSGGGDSSAQVCL